MGMSAPRLHTGTSWTQSRTHPREWTDLLGKYLPEHSIHKFNDINYSLSTPCNHSPLTGVSTFFSHYHQYLCYPCYNEVGHSVVISFTTIGVFSYLIKVFIFAHKKTIVFCCYISGLCYTSDLKVVHRCITLNAHLLNLWCPPLLVYGL
jgi:hypothetical protein